MIPHITEPPAIVTPNKRGICISVNKPCFVLNAPKNKAPQLKENKLRTEYYIHRMKSLAKSAQDPDMNMSLNEIKTGIKVSDRMKMSLFVYLLGALIIFMNMK